MNGSARGVSNRQRSPSLSFYLWNMTMTDTATKTRKTAPKAAAGASENVLISLAKLVIDENNVRKVYKQDTIEILAKNIDAKGVLQNLCVRKLKGGKFAVAAGGRRLRALQLLAEQKTITANYQVACKIVSDDEAIEISLSENEHREAMHPADQLEAWAALAANGLSVEEIAKRHGVTSNIVNRRLKLGALSPAILQAFRRDVISIDAATAFTYSDDHKEQERVLEDGHTQPRAIKNELTQKGVSHLSRKAGFVGIEKYTKAGGFVRETMFEEEKFLEDVKLLDALFLGQIKTNISKLELEGWAWVEFSEDTFVSLHEKYERVSAKGRDFTPEEQKVVDTIEGTLTLCDGTGEVEEGEIARLELELNDMKAKLEEYTAEERAQLGVICHIDRDGDWIETVGLKAVDKAKKPSAEEHKPHAPVTISGYSGKLQEALELVRKDCVRAYGLENPAHMIEFGHFETIRRFMAAKTTSLAIKDSSYNAYASPEEIDPLGTLKSDAIIQAFYDKVEFGDWVDQDDSETAFKAYLELDETLKRDLLALAYSKAVVPQWSGKNYSDTGINSFLSELDFQPRDYWLPDETFFKRLTAPQGLELLAELGLKEIAERMADNKKSEIAAALALLFNSAFGEHPDIKDQETFDRIANWCPKGMEA